MKKTLLIIGVVLAGALVLSACQQSAPATTAPSATATTAASAGNASNENGSGNTSTSENDNAAPAGNDNASDNSGGESVELQNVTEGLGSLDSYESTFNMSFEGTKDGESDSWTWVMEEAYIKNPPAKRSSFTSTGANAEAAGGFETIEVDGKTYSRFGEMCASSDSSEAPEANTTFSPSDIIGDIRTSQLVGVENINGVSAKHYVVDANSIIALGGYTNAKGEAWIADPGNFVVKYLFEATGKDQFFGGDTNTEGTIRWDYEVKSINQPVEIKAPEDCGGAPADIPIMADAKDQSAFGEMTTYASPSAFEDVVNFYKEQMPANGWSEDTSGGMSTDNFASLSFKKDGSTASITISFDTSNNTTSVLITVSQ
jgi:hypothetical protein